MIRESYGQESTPEEVIQEIENVTRSGRMFGFDWGEYGYIQLGYDPEKDILYGGDATNSFVSHDFEIEYDHSCSLDQNLETLYEKIVEEIGFPEDNISESKKKTIKKKDLKCLVEGVLNELDWKTYMNAAKKNADEYSYYDFDDDEGRRKNYRTDSFVDAARNAYKNKYGSDTQTDYESYDLGHGRGHGKHNYETTYAEPYWEEYGDDYDENDDEENGRWIQGRTRTEFTNDYDGEFRRDFPEVNTQYEEDDDNSVYGYDRNVSNYSDDEMPDEWKDVANYANGKSKYEKGKGWTNESRKRFVNYITEAVINKIRKR